ncbi:sensor histidine kinase [Bacillus haynesii]|uniref:sensor histidine kinase n=1 Tax=Bacillus haynesii TaxID=1925021 RepID=UPI002282FD21|nr:sensor histidine kinase [Bacillus haynesii]MCY8144115.1 sensor histidine kinase [Bacillus haynesii]MEC1454338.1 sensor histidine kinase [Bacillus haynesii]MEC1553623.1 sensor histidine kinase [Bacillus haynesii]MEC1574920.1 sensor histidine kinase [Bacillus haynesii]
MKNARSPNVRILIEKAIVCISVYSIITSIFLMYPIHTKQFVFLLTITLCLIINDQVRLKFFTEKSFLYYVFLILSTILSGILLWGTNSMGAQIYITLLLIEMVVTVHKIPWWAVSLHFMTFFPALYFIGTDVKDIIVAYLVMMSIIYLFRNILLEKTKIQMLNRELKEVNNTLKQYSKQIQELTISKERTRIAQELHDSLGHYLTALTMNLEFSVKTADKNPIQAQQAINKSHDLSKECMRKLRKAVALLNDDAPQKELMKSINEMFNNFQGKDQIIFDFDMDSAIESADPDIKNCLYKTVQEAITNGIKHGGATNFSIEICKIFEEISVTIIDNGTGCSKISKSNGLKGIENRITALGGEVEFYSENRSGFTIKAEIPLIADL